VSIRRDRSDDRLHRRDDHPDPQRRRNEHDRHSQRRGRLAQPAEIAAVAVYLTGPDTVFVNGPTWEIDAGRTAR
jgi:NAD(P)-dependent dehydrogenase (short-subunit alcohol dehydrogenase family)